MQADEEWFDYRLKLFQAVYKGKSRWYAPWVLLPEGCDNGAWAKRYGAEALQKYVKLHESFVEHEYNMRSLAVDVMTASVLVGRDTDVLASATPR